MVVRSGRCTCEVVVVTRVIKYGYGGRRHSQKVENGRRNEVAELDSKPLSAIRTLSLALLGNQATSKH